MDIGHRRFIKMIRQNFGDVLQIEEKNYIQLIAKILACFDLKRHYLRDNIWKISRILDKIFHLIDAILHINKKKQNNFFQNSFQRPFLFLRIVAGPTVEAHRRSPVDSPRIHSAAKVYLGLVRNNRDLQFTHPKSKDNATLGTVAEYRVCITDTHIQIPPSKA